MIADLWLKCVLRPLGRLLRTDRWEPCAVFEGHCLACGAEAMHVIPADSPCFDPETQAFFGVQCGDCLEWAVTSL